MVTSLLQLLWNYQIQRSVMPNTIR